MPTLESITGPDGVKQVELEFLATPKGVVRLIDTISENYVDSPSVLSTLRVFDLEKVSTFRSNVLLPRFCIALFV